MRKFMRILTLVVTLVMAPFTTFGAQAAAFHQQATCAPAGQATQNLDVTDGGLKFGQSVNQTLLAQLKAFGGSCDIVLTAPMQLKINSSQGRINVDGNPARGDFSLFTGQRVHVDYDANNFSNGFEILVIPGSAAPVTAAVAPPNTSLAASCTINGTQYNLLVDPFHPNGWRLYMDDATLSAGRGVNGDIPCHSTNPYGGTLEIAPTNRSSATEEFFFVKGGQSFGFAIQTPFHGSAGTQAAASTSTQSSGGPLGGSCTINGTQYNLLIDPFHPNGTRGYMGNDLLAAGRGVSGKVPCHYVTPKAATLEISPSNREIAAGTEEFIAVDGGQSFGFAIQTH